MVWTDRALATGRLLDPRPALSLGFVLAEHTDGDLGAGAFGAPVLERLAEENRPFAKRARDHGTSLAERRDVDCGRYLRYRARVSEDETFQVPLPPPPLPPPHGDVLFFRHEVEREGEGAREHEDILLRRVPREVAGRFRAGAGGRGLTHAQYLTALVELHRKLREQADAADECARALLDELGLTSVTV